MTPQWIARRARAFTVVELVLVLGILAVLAALGTSAFRGYTERARTAEAIVGLKFIETELKSYQLARGFLPATLADADLGHMVDPWGNAYRYLRLSDAPLGQARKDRFLVPINSDFDLYSMGPDGQSRPPLTARESRDDIIRASDGSYFGAAAGY